MLLHHYWKFRDGKIAYYRGAEDTLLTLRTVDRLTPPVDGLSRASHVVGHRHHRDAGLEQQPGLHLQRPVVVQAVLPPLGDELADHHGDEVGALGLERLDLVRAAARRARGRARRRRRAAPGASARPTAPRAVSASSGSSAMCTARTRSGRSSSATRSASRAPSWRVATGTSATCVAGRPAEQRVVGVGRSGCSPRRCPSRTAARP